MENDLIKFKLWPKYLLLLCCALLFSITSRAQFDIKQVPVYIDGNSTEWSGLELSVHVSDAFGSGVLDSSFTQGSKDFLPALDNRWTYVQTNSKNDFANASAILT